MRVGLAQINSIVADLRGNVDRIVSAVDEAKTLRADLVVFPELAVTGCTPKDIFFDRSFADAVGEANSDLAARVADGPTVVVGSATFAHSGPACHPGLLNSALVLRRGEVWAEISKRLLRCDGVHLEPRWFLPGPPGPEIEVGGERITVVVGGAGEDRWGEDDFSEQGKGVIICPAAFEYEIGAFESRLARIRKLSRPVVLVNACGANDELLFEGRSFVMSAEGRLLGQLPLGREAVRVVDLESEYGFTDDVVDLTAELADMLTVGIRDFVRKNNLGQAFVGLSGGIDSSVVACLAARALGPDRVVGVAMPSRYTDPRSTEAAEKLARNLGISFEIVELERMHHAAEKTLGAPANGGVAAENVQARLRMTLLMAMVDGQRGFLLNTSNKTELALGYGTLYGDLAGAICPIGDLNKLQVIEVGRYIAAKTGEIPAYVIEREPTAELRFGQVDPFDYSEVAPLLDEMVDCHRCNTVMRNAEHKRWQGGVVLKVSRVAFGSGRFMPVTRR